MQKVTLITGTNRGTGMATAQRLAADVYDICIHHYSNSELAWKLTWR